jgi:hypothetical protein
MVDVTVQSGANETDNFSDNPDANVNAPIFGYGISAATTADQFTYGGQTIGPTGGQTISPTNSKVSFASQTDESGGTDQLTIVVEDTTGNTVIDLDPSAFSFSIAGGASAGTFSAVTPTATPGTYTTVFTGTTAGTASTLTVTVSGVALATGPTIRVIAGEISASTSTTRFATPTVGLGRTDTVTITVMDDSGNPITGLGNSAFRFALAGGSSRGKFGRVSATSTPGMYRVVFTGTKAGTTSALTTKVRGITLTARPTIQVLRKVKSSSKVHNRSIEIDRRVPQDRRFDRLG